MDKQVSVTYDAFCYISLGRNVGPRETLTVERFLTLFGSIDPHSRLRKAVLDSRFRVGLQIGVPSFCPCT